MLLAFAALFFTSMAASAATITFETKVPGYSKAGWILVQPERRHELGGRVVYNAQLRRWVTDRVERGHELRVKLSPTTRSERCRNGGLSGIYASNGVFKWAAVSLPYTKTVRVSRDPGFDNVYVWVYTTSGYTEQRIPIGLRPR
jgi:hypothetical protein